MNQANHSKTTHTNQPGATLPGVKRGPLSAEEQALAVQQLHEHAQRRLTLGMQLFENAQKQTQVHQALADQLRKEQDEIRTQMQTDMTRSLHTYDQWIGKVEHDFATRLDVLDRRMSELQAQWQAMSARVEGMMQRAEMLLDQARLINGAAIQLSRQPLQAKPAMQSAQHRLVTVVETMKPLMSMTSNPAATTTAGAVTNVNTNANTSHDHVHATTQAAISAEASTEYAMTPRLADDSQLNEPTVRYLELLDLLRQAPPTQNAA